MAKRERNPRKRRKKFELSAAEKAEYIMITKMSTNIKKHVN